MKTINWKVVSFIVGSHLLVFMGLILSFILGAFNWPIFFVTLALWFVTGMSITAGYHRLYTHQSYKTNRIIEFFLLFFGSMTAEGSAYSWAYDHRLHHSHVDTERDPYSVKKGFWHAHILWMFKKSPEIDPKVVRDLERNPLVMNQHKYYGFWVFGTNLSTTLLVGWLTGAYLLSFLFVWGVRMLLCYHCTWFINSLAHCWGARSFSKEQTAVDNFIISLLTFGEGYHNFHHTFARDYRNGIRWYHYDPGKWFIWICAKLGLASSLAKTPVKRIEERVKSEKMVEG